MDPLTITTGIVGILAASGQLIQALDQLGSAIQDAASDTQAAAIELTNIKLVVQGLQTYVIGRVQSSPQRLQLISVENITATLTGCIVTYSDLDAILKSLHADTGLRAWDRAKWFLKKDSVVSLIQRLQGHKGTFNTMLNILQCSSLDEAETEMQHLSGLVDQLLAANRDLSMRMSNIESCQHSSALAPSASVETPPNPIQDHALPAPAMDQSSSLPSVSAPSVERVGRVSQGSGFEDFLHRSRVYRHVHSDAAYEPSLATDMQSTLALSFRSGLTLGEISNISVYALPVFSAELSNASCYELDLMSDLEFDRALHAFAEIKPRRSTNTWLKLARRAAYRSVYGSKIFGVPLSSIKHYAYVHLKYFNAQGEEVWSMPDVPIIVSTCCSFLEQKVAAVEHVFEHPALDETFVKLQTIFESAPNFGAGLDWTEYTVHDAARLLLHYVSQLPEPLIPDRLYQKFCEPLRIHQVHSSQILRQDPTIGLERHLDFDSTIETYQRLFLEVPGLNTRLCERLLDLLGAIAYQSDRNNMTSQRLATIFQPIILRIPHSVFAKQEKVVTQSVVGFLIESKARERNRRAFWESYSSNQNFSGSTEDPE